MTYRSTTSLQELARLRARGQRPLDAVVVGLDGLEASWAERNRFFYVPASECESDLSPFADLFVLIRTKSPERIRDLAQHMALTARMVTLYDLKRGQSEFLHT